MRRTKVELSEKRVEMLRIWYAIFIAILDMPDTDAINMEQLRKLRQRIREEAPELEAKP